ncbi:MAG: transglutaminase-like domain-containing protein [Microbacteriaceae bacterium]|nr:transglutaminase-like domain-containing protein [Microbacteriaceae bacterium]MCL2796211.1 transglutaminase-like domain-containing protein [Microbacteriaceae bacterium]
MSTTSRRRPALALDAALVVDGGFVLALAAVATFAAWPIYETSYMFVTVGGAVLLGGGIALAGRLRRWSWLATAGAVLAAYLVLGVPLAVPRAFASRADFVLSYRDLLAATVGSWRKLITVQAPVGSFQTLLVPLYITMLVCTAAAFALVFHRARGYGALVPIMLTPVAFAVAFGTSRDGHWVVAGLEIPGAVHMLVGILALGLAGGFLVWRAQHARSVAVAAATRASGIRRAGGTVAGTVRRLVGAVAVVIVGFAVAVPLSSTALAPTSRHVLSDAVDPTPVLRRYVSPLISYRKAFDAGTYGATLLSYRGDADAVGRLRLATLSFYDGQQFTVLSSDADVDDSFRHIPEIVGAGRQAAGLARLDVTMGDLARLGTPDVWLPTAADLRAIAFEGADANALTDGFYFNEALQSGAELKDPKPGDVYSMLVAPAKSTPELGSVQPVGGTVLPTNDIPASLTAWVQQQNAGSGGAGLQTLIDRLRARGYLSHALDQPTAATGGTATWLSDVARASGRTETAAFQSSLAGESMDRIGAMFTALDNQQKAAGAGADDAKLVAAVGDDEQFAVASALIAESLGFPARVVLGFALDGSLTDGSPIPACSNGVCQGKNLTAWVEVQASDGSWVPITTTPQDRNPIARTDTPQSQPRIVTPVQPRGATVQPPPEANPSGGDNPTSGHAPKGQQGVAAWMPELRLGGQIATVLLVLLAPLLAVAIVKAARRRERRTLTGAAARVAAGWDELVDTAVDLGLPAPGVRTRVEAAAVYAAAARTADPQRMRTLASGADEAVFGAFDPTPDEAEQYWAGLDEQRSRLAAGFPRWKRLRAMISLRSFGTRGGGSA